MSNIDFMICADMHLDSTFAADNELRREEQKFTFKKIIDMALESDAELLLIPGDLFDVRNPSEETVNFVIDQFKRILNTQILIAPGNHDPYTTDSPYSYAKWPENVYIFAADRMQCFEMQLRESCQKNMRVYGIANSGHFTRKSLLRDSKDRLPILDNDYINILLMHGDAEVSKSVYNPLTTADLKACGFDLCALGHRHRYENTPLYTYAGVPYPRGFDEWGECGIVEGTVSDGGAVIHWFVPVEGRRYHEVDIDAESVEDCSVDEFCDEILKHIKPGKDFYKIIISGRVPEGRKINCSAIVMRLEEEYPGIRVEDRTELMADYNLISRENSLRGIFIRRLLEMQRVASREKVVDKQAVADAMELGLKAFDGTLTASDD
ncbi:MAG: metallophosphoesterase [Clostridia bacterium]|nr:metallophosphoesterase [Clostridia bacterium]